MTYRHVALLGRARSGKDTVAGRLVQRYQFTRLAFADEVRRAALDLDPIVGAQPFGMATLPIRLSDVVNRYGWERSKTEYPEVRRTLQQLGESVRQGDPDYWLRIVRARVETAMGWSLPVVVSDVRYRNELAALRRWGFLVVRVDRPGAGAGGDAENHVSETELNGAPVDVTIPNSGSLEDLYALADTLAVRR
ncbi:hypothetical protein ACGF0D_25680 [Kitasatospora sp. NPDC048298]|uniref:deoxynucleotide monophosphate kinase family protein n=1 Tax=Kitasatospora sp. NPDC048298 TaxID=3364049 RepID=UPI0037108079